jgi:hypothetical protein
VKWKRCRTTDAPGSTGDETAGKPPPVRATAGRSSAVGPGPGTGRRRARARRGSGRDRGAAATRGSRADNSRCIGAFPSGGSSTSSGRSTRSST